MKSTNIKADSSFWLENKISVDQRMMIGETGHYSPH